MKHLAFFSGLIVLLMASCSIQEETNTNQESDAVTFYASFEQPREGKTRVYANEDLFLRWTADDRVSIFNRITYNQEYRFIGETGDNAGGFNRVDAAEFVTGNPISHVVSVYPYQTTTKITESEELTVMLPAEQIYAQNTFGLGANTMVSVSSDNILQYKNVGGYLVFSLYGEGVSVESLTLKGNNGERLAGKANITMPLDGIPTVVMTDAATTEITLICAAPIQLGATPETSTQFWFVVPPVTFSKGFTITVNETNGGTMKKSTSNSIAIDRNKLSMMAPLEVEKITPSWAISFTDDKVKSKLIAAFDTNGDGELSYEEAAAVTSGVDLSSAFGSIKTYKSFDEFQYFTGITSISNGTFQDWNLLSSITLPNSIKEIGGYAFSGCVNLSSIVLPEGIEYIQGYAFNECTSLNSIALPDGLKSLGAYAFYNCSKIKGSVTIPSGITKLGAYTFYNCASVDEFIFKGAIQTIANYCFFNCNSLTTIDLPNGLVSIGDCCFRKCSSIVSITLPNTLRIWGAWAFGECSGLTNVILPSGLTIIPRYCFYRCSNLQAINIPDSVSQIEDGAFCDCSSLLSISIPESVTYIGGSSEESEGWGRTSVGAFENCSSLTSLVIPESISVINISVFRGCKGLLSITIPESVTKISISAFRQCSSLKQISIPSSVTTVEDYAFAECSSLESVFIPHTISSLGGCVFYLCRGLKSAIVDEGITVLPGGTFNNCSSLTSVVLPESLTEIDSYYVRNLGYQGCFAACKNLTSITLPSSITSIGHYTFSACSGIKTIQLPENLKKLGQNAFYYCDALETITLPRSIEDIGAYSFYGCSDLASIRVLAESVPRLESWSLDKTNNCPIYVPAVSLEAYRTTGVWQNYSSRIFAIPE